jgi:hypothetical protein
VEARYGHWYQKGARSRESGHGDRVFLLDVNQGAGQAGDPGRFDNSRKIVMI